MKKKRIILGEGYPWFLGNYYTTIALAKTKGLVCADPQTLKFGKLGAWQKIRLVAEIVGGGGQNEKINAVANTTKGSG